MAKVLTTASKVGCSHEGKITLSSTAKLKVQGKPVILKTDTTAWAIPDCSTKPSNSTKPCTAFSSIAQESANKLKVNQTPVVLDSLTGTTDGNPVGSASVSANQQLLNAV